MWPEMNDELDILRMQDERKRDCRKKSPSPEFLLANCTLLTEICNNRAVIKVPSTTGTNVSCLAAEVAPGKKGIRCITVFP
jgi:hypothetical protein